LERFTQVSAYFLTEVGRHLLAFLDSSFPRAIPNPTETEGRKYRMNIRGLTGIFSPLVYKAREKIAGNASADRDAHGEQGQQNSERRRNLSQEELEKAVAFLVENPGVKSNNLNVRLDQTGVAPVILILDASGKVIRRIPEADISLMDSSKAERKGAILNRAL
jgi:uncharacterized FlaG/YvyC family protein